MIRSLVFAVWAATGAASTAAATESTLAPFAGTAASVLALPATARFAALASAGSAFSDDPDSARANPAGRAGGDGLWAAASLARFPFETSLTRLTLERPFGPTTANVSLVRADLGETDQRTVLGQPGPRYGGSDLGLSLSVSRRLERSPGVSVGASATWLHERVFFTTASALAFGAGLVADLRPADEEPLRLAVSVLDAGTRLGVSPLPARVVAGAASAWRPQRFPGVRLLGALDAVVPFRGGQSLRAAAELSVTGAVFARAGFEIGAGGSSVATVGAGVRWRALGLDWAYASAGTVGAVHRMTLSVGSAPPRRDP